MPAFENSPENRQTSRLFRASLVLTTALAVFFSLGEFLLVFSSKEISHGPDPIFHWVEAHFLRVMMAGAWLSLAWLIINVESRVLGLRLLWVGLGGLAGYRILFYYYNVTLPCKCLGIWQQLFSLTDDAATLVTLALLLLMIVASAVLTWAMPALHLGKRGQSH